jgi:hypothetical protein
MVAIVVHEPIDGRASRLYPTNLVKIGQMSLLKYAPACENDRGQMPYWSGEFAGWAQPVKL